MAGFYSGDKHLACGLGSTDNRSLAELVGEIGIRFPRALKKYWTVFAVGFVLGTLLSVPQKSKLETTLDKVNHDASRLIQETLNEQRRLSQAFGGH